MGASLLPARGVFVPTRLIFNLELPAVIRDTLVQLMALAWSNANHELPPVSYPQLSGLMGKSIATLHGHFAVLRTYHAALRLRSAGNGLIIVTLADWLYVHKPGTQGAGASKKLEPPVKDQGSDPDPEEEQEENLLDHPDDHLPGGVGKTNLSASPASDPGEKKLPESLAAELVEAGIFSFLLPEVARAGWSEAELLALLTWCQEDNPERPGGLFMARLRKQVLVPDKYYGERCKLCHRVGKHAPDCRMGYMTYSS